MNTNKQWSYEEDQKLFEYVWDHSKYPNSTTMHSQRAIKEFPKMPLWSIYGLISRQMTGIGIRLKLYANFIQKFHPDYTWSKIDFVPAFRNWHYNSSHTKKHKEETTQPAVPVGKFDTPKTILYLGKIYQFEIKETWDCQNCKIPKVQNKNGVWMCPTDKGFGCGRHFCGGVGRWVPLKTNNQPMPKDNIKIIRIGTGNYYPIQVKEKRGGCPVCPSQGDKCPFNLGSKDYADMCMDFCEENGLNPFTVFEKVPGETIMSIKNIIIPKSNPKPFTIDNVPENAILTYRNGERQLKCGDHIIHLDSESAGFKWSENNTRFLNKNLTLINRDYKGWDYVSIKEITIGPELMQPEKLKYSVVDTEDNILQTLESTKELHLVKE